VRFLLLVPAAALAALGGDGLYHALRSRERIAVDCGEFARARPASHRVAVTGCEIDLAGLGYREADGRLQELFLPARPAGRAVPAPLVIVTREPAALALAQGAVGGAATLPPERSAAVMQQVVAVLGVTTTIDGVMRAGIIERLRARRVVSGLMGAPVAADAALIDLNGRPDFLRPILALAAAFLLSLGPWALSRRPRRTLAARRNSRSEWSSPTDDLRGAAAEDRRARRTSRVVVPRLLLLGLDVSAGPDAIETAPPLGTRHDVAGILTGVIPDLHVDPAARILSRADNSLTLDLGPHESIATIVVDARGEAGVVLVKEILLMTGWRAFAPKTGLFVTANELGALAALAAEEESSTDGSWRAPA
jgi:hypothetical protein